jgi:hypothetical protein
VDRTTCNAEKASRPCDVVLGLNQHAPLRKLRGEFDLETPAPPGTAWVSRGTRPIGNTPRQKTIPAASATECSRASNLGRGSISRSYFHRTAMASCSTTAPASTLRRRPISGSTLSGGREPAPPPKHSAQRSPQLAAKQ